MKIEWNKVTTLSKVVAGVLFLTLPFLGFYLGAKYSHLKASQVLIDESLKINENVINNHKSYIKKDSSPARKEVCVDQHIIDAFPEEVISLENNTINLNNNFPWIETHPIFEQRAIYNLETYDNIFVCGREWIAHIKTDTFDDLKNVHNKFVEEYIEKAGQKGWTRSIDSMGYKIIGGAGEFGLGGEFAGYVRSTNNLIRVIIFSNEHIDNNIINHNQELRIFISDIVPIKDVISQMY